MISWVALVISILAFVVSASQAETARQKLRSDVFDRRYAVFAVFYQLVKAAMLKQDLTELLNQAAELTNQSYFLLSPSTHQYLTELMQKVRFYEAEGEVLHTYEGYEQRKLAGEQHMKSYQALDASYNELISCFKPFLSFEDRPWWVRSVRYIRGLAVRGSVHRFVFAHLSQGLPKPPAPPSSPPGTPPAGTPPQPPGSLP